MTTLTNFVRRISAQEVVDGRGQTVFRHSRRQVADDNALSVDEDESRSRRDAVAEHGFIADWGRNGIGQSVDLLPGLLDLLLLLASIGRVEACRREEGDALRSVFLDGPAKRRRLHLAVAAGFPPEEEHNGLSTKGFERRDLGSHVVLGLDGGGRLPLELDLVPALPDSRPQVVRRLFLRP